MTLHDIFKSIALLYVILFAHTEARSQELPARQSFGVSGTFAPDSSHILIGRAEQRRTWTVGLEYGRTIWGNRFTRLDYEGSITPFFQERDPTVIGTTTTIAGSTSFTPVQVQRVVYVNHNPVGGATGGGGILSPVYDVYSSTKTFAFAVSPIGARLSGFNSHKLQPTFSVDMGVVFSSRDLPVDNSASLNYLFSFGPGFEYFYAPNGAVRLEYLYRHISNANSGIQNPGVDQGTFRLTLSRRRR